MDSNDLTRVQCEALQAEIGRMADYLDRLRKRMTAERFPPNDPLVLRTSTAYNAILALGVELHYLKCDSGVGRLPRGNDNTNCDSN